MTDEGMEVAIAPEAASPQPVYVLDQEQFDYYKTQGSKWRRIAVASIILAAISSSSVILDRVLDQLDESKLETLAQENHDALEILENQTSPETQAQRQAALETLLVTLDCNNREAIQELADQLVNQRLIQPVTVVCEEKE